MAAPQPALAPSSTPHVPGWKWAVIWIMFFATMLNYMDRQTMASTQTFIRDEFKIDKQGYGQIEFYFSITFAIMQLPAGWMADHMNIRWLYAGAVLVWSVAGLCTGFADTLFTLYLCRIVLGIGESFNFICAAGVVGRIMPRETRSLANGIFNGGASVGSALTPILAMLIVGAAGEHWRTLFVVVGAAGLVWAIGWFAVVHGTRAEEMSTHPESADLKVPFSEVMKRPIFWIVFIYGAAINLTWHFYRFWLSPLLTDERHVDTKTLQWFLMAFFVCADIGSMLAGWVTRMMVRKGLSVEEARKRAMYGCAALCLLSGPATMVDNMYVAMPMICLIGMGAMGCFASYYSMVQEISGPHTARCLGMLGSLIWFCIAVMQPAAGWAVERMKTFTPMLVAVGFLPLIGVFISLTWLDKERKKTAQS